MFAVSVTQRQRRGASADGTLRSRRAVPFRASPLWNAGPLRGVGMHLRTYLSFTLSWSLAALAPAGLAYADSSPTATANVTAPPPAASTSVGAQAGVGQIEP